VEDYGKCSHVIQIANNKHEIGLVQQEDGSFGLIWDNYGGSGMRLDNLIRKKHGNMTFEQRYGLEVARIELEAAGMVLAEPVIEENGDLIIEAIE
jgi:hypothetical protein